ncbi:MAG: TRAP transporter small permease [Peptostreptococcaceae bacterium]|nr:TRAP transporter small permease [Peptostreptococcaceae bacterium]
MKKFFNIYNSIMGLLGMLCLLGFILSIVIQVVARTLLPYSPSWTEEAARYLFIYMVAFGSSVAVHKQEFVGVDFVLNMLNEKANHILRFIINAGLLAFCLYVLTQSVLPFALIKYRMVSTAMQIPMQFVYFSMIIFFGLLISSFLFEIIDMLFFNFQDIEEQKAVE